MTQTEALKRSLERLESIASNASAAQSTMLLAELMLPITSLRGVIAEQEKAKRPSTTLATTVIATAATVAALAVVWAGFYAVHMTSGTWMEVPVVITASVIFGVCGVIAVASADIAKHFVKGTP
jgi:hypothetical protein